MKVSDSLVICVCLMASSHAARFCLEDAEVASRAPAKCGPEFVSAIKTERYVRNSSNTACYNQNAKYLPFDMVVGCTQVMGARQCQQLCNDNHRCAYFTFQRFYGHCYLSDANAEAYKTDPSERLTAGPKCCQSGSAGVRCQSSEVVKEQAEQQYAAAGARSQAEAENQRRQQQARGTEEERQRQEIQPVEAEEQKKQVHHDAEQKQKQRQQEAQRVAEEQQQRKKAQDSRQAAREAGNAQRREQVDKLRREREDSEAQARKQQKIDLINEEIRSQIKGKKPLEIVNKFRNDKNQISADDTPGKKRKACLSTLRDFHPDKAPMRNKSEEENLKDQEVFKILSSLCGSL